MIKKFLFVAALVLGLAACSGNAGSKADAAVETPADSIIEMAVDNVQADTASAKVKFETTLGSFTVLLYGDTPGHRDNFLKLVRNHQYDSLLFHRVINEFMVQGGDPDSKNAGANKQLGSGDIGGTIPAEIIFPKHYHKRGALAAARTGDQVNPERRSSGSQFYVVTGRKYSEAEIAQLQEQLLQQKYVDDHMDQIMKLQQSRDREGLMALQADMEKWVAQKIKKGETVLTPEMVKTYTTVGGAPHLDGQYTVYGEVIEGMDTIERIEKTETGPADRPIKDVRILSANVVE